MSSTAEQSHTPPAGTPLPITPLEKHPSLSDLDYLCINTIRCLAMDAVQKAKSGHPGMPMGMAPAAMTLWTRHLRHNPANPAWPNRDRFVLSAGHGCMLLYALLYLTGYDLSLEDLKNFRQWGSKTPGHPEHGHTPGVEVTTGPLGQGISNAVGMAIARHYLAARFNREGFPIVDYRIFVITGDGDLQEGVSSEASSLAGHLALDNLVVIYDDNRITIDGSTSLSFDEDVARRYEAYGWFVQTVEGDGNDMAAFEQALERAIAEPARPALIKLRTHIGFGSPNKQDSAEAHGSPLGEEEVARTKERLGWDPALSFHVPDEALEYFRSARTRGSQAEEAWQQLFTRYAKAYPELAAEFTRARDGMMPPDWERLWASRGPAFAPGAMMATREAQGKVLDAIMPELPLVVGGSADLTPSNNTRFKGAEDFSATCRTGRYIRYGVREHAMGAIMNGIAVSGLVIPYGATFFVFSDYMRPAVRLAALSRYPVIFSYTHDSIGLGEDGPTHQAVEQLASFRAMPGMVVLRPADANETAVAWRFALEHRDGPVMLALTRQKLPVLDRTLHAPAENLRKGAYVVAGAKDPRVLLLASGSEVHLALEAMKALGSEGIAARVVSMPSWELFEQQSKEYREEVLPRSVRARVAVEAGVRLGWERYIGQDGVFVGMESFGASAPYQKAYEGFGITTAHIVASAKGLL
jgi:transketolase